MWRRIRRFFQPRHSYHLEARQINIPNDSVWTVDESSSSHIVQRQLREFLDKYYEGPVDILEESVEFISPPGTIPQHCRINIILETILEQTEEISIFVKMLVDKPDDFKEDESTYMRLDALTKLKKEVQVHAIVLEKIEKFQKKLKIKEEFHYRKLFAKCIGTRISFHLPSSSLPDYSSAVIFEDLITKNYESQINNRGYKGFDFLTSKTILQNMARLHACPIAMHVKDKVRFEESIIPVLNLKVKYYEKTHSFEKLFHELIKYGLKDDLQTLRYIEDIRDSLEFCALHDWFDHDQVDKTWFTVCHSRYWIPNVMVRKPDLQEPQTSKLLEMHRAHFGNCCIDLAFFMFTSIKPEILVRSFEEMIQEYYIAFKQTLVEHKIPLAKYGYERFLLEFHTMGSRMLNYILFNIRTISCKGYDKHGEPMLGSRYRKRVKAALRVMLQNNWIKIVDSDLSSDSEEPLDILN